MIDHISYSAIKTWYDCPYLFKLKEIDRLIPSGGSIHTVFGNAIHKVCEHLLCDTKEDMSKVFLNEFKSKLNGLPNIKELLEKEENKKLIKDMKGQAASITPEILPAIKNFFGDFKLVSTECLLTEKMPLTDLKFKGFVDLVIYTKETGKYHIIDWKSSGWGWKPEQKTDKVTIYQLILYKNFLCQKLGLNLEDVETYFGLLKRTVKPGKHVEIFRVTSGKKRSENAVAWIELPIKNIEKGFFPKKSSRCNNCLGREVCQSQK